MLEGLQLHECTTLLAELHPNLMQSLTVGYAVAGQLVRLPRTDSSITQRCAWSSAKPGFVHFLICRTVFCYDNKCLILIHFEDCCDVSIQTKQQSTSIV